MVWVAYDRAIRSAIRFGLDGPVERWRAMQKSVKDEVCRKGYDESVGAFTQSFGSKKLDASLLLMPIVGFLPAGDERVRSTVAAIEHKLTQDGLVMRYEEDSGSAFLPCSFWMVAVLILLNRRNDAIDLLEKLRSLSNDAGLLAEEYDLRNKRLMGNFPQAFTHVSLVNAIHMLNGAGRDVRIKVAVCRPACAHTPNIAQPPCWRSGRRTVNTAAPFGYAEPEPPPPTMRDHRQSGERSSAGRDRLDRSARCSR